METTLPNRTPRCLILVGASTGGTRVLTGLLKLLPRLSAAIVIVQHMPKFINDSLVESLSKITPSPVRLAADADRLAEGEILLAPSEVHCSLVTNRSLALTTGPKVQFVCPSVDVLMQSAKWVPNQKIIGILLTGMGRDGAAGMRHLKGLGAITVAQDKASCAVYGMPAEAVKTGCIDHQLSPEGIAKLLQTLVPVQAPRAASHPLSSAPVTPG